MASPPKPGIRLLGTPLRIIENMSLSGTAFKYSAFLIGRPAPSCPSAPWHPEHRSAHMISNPAVVATEMTGAGLGGGFPGRRSQATDPTVTTANDAASIRRRPFNVDARE